MKHVATFTCERLLPEVMERYLRMKGVEARVGSNGWVYSSWSEGGRASELVAELVRMAKARGWDPTEQKLELLRETEQMRSSRRKLEKRTGMEWPFSYFLKRYHDEQGLF